MPFPQKVFIFETFAPMPELGLWLWHPKAPITRLWAPASVLCNCNYPAGGSGIEGLGLVLPEWRLGHRSLGGSITLLLGSGMGAFWGRMADGGLWFLGLGDSVKVQSGIVGAALGGQNRSS